MLFRSLPNLDLITGKDELKFVISDEDDFRWTIDFIRRHQLEGRCELLASPVWGKIDASELVDWIVESSLPIRLNMQLHKIIWGPVARGV